MRQQKTKFLCASWNSSCLKVIWNMCIESVAINLWLHILVCLLFSSTVIEQFRISLAEPLIYSFLSSDFHSLWKQTAICSFIRDEKMYHLLFVEFCIPCVLFHIFQMIFLQSTKFMEYHHKVWIWPHCVTGRLILSINLYPGTFDQFAFYV